MRPEVNLSVEPKIDTNYNKLQTLFHEDRGLNYHSESKNTKPVRAIVTLQNRGSAKPGFDTKGELQKLPENKRTSLPSNRKSSVVVRNSHKNY